MRCKKIYVGKDSNGNLVFTGDGLKKDGVYLGKVTKYSLKEFRIKSVLSINDIPFDLKSCIRISKKEEQEEIFNQFCSLLEKTLRYLRFFRKSNPQRSNLLINDLLDSRLRFSLINLIYSLKNMLKQERRKV